MHPDFKLCQSLYETLQGIINAQPVVGSCPREIMEEDFFHKISCEIANFLKKLTRVVNTCLSLTDIITQVSVVHMIKWC